MAGCIFHPIHSPESNATLYTAAQRSVRLRENSVTHAQHCIQQHLQSIPIVSRFCLPEASTPRSIVSSTGVLRFQYIFLNGSLGSFSRITNINCWFGMRRSPVDVAPC